MACDERDLELRRGLKLQLIQNPNYYSNLSELKLEGIPEAVEKKISDTTFEELTCLGYNPDTRILTAIVEIKEESGYLGGPCTDGSFEYIRFYLDYGSGWVDHGTASFNIHDLSFEGELCYAVSIQIDPQKQSCCDSKPVLPRVRAILSWNIEPPLATPNYLPVYGNRLERDIQIEPRNPIFCTFIDQFEAPGVAQIDPSLLKKVKEHLTVLPPPPNPVTNLTDLVKEADPKSEFASLRAVFPLVTQLANDNTDIASFKALESLKGLQIDLSKFNDFFLEPNFNTGYEELHCVGLDRDRDMLHGIVEIKRQSGYSGDLCSNGSLEYIAFYLDFGLGWEYQGTTAVNVHNIKELEDGSLWYQAALPVNLDAERKEWCETGRARIRGILSWAVPPPPHVPNYIPHWGNREDCWIEIKPLPPGASQNPNVPFIESIGSMPVNQINGAGFANGPNIGGTLTAAQSPFGGTINIAGKIAFPTSNNLEYRVMVKGPSDVIFKPWDETFNVTVITVVGINVTFTSQAQITNGGWYAYIPQSGPVFKTVAGNLLAPFEASEEGMHEMYIQVRQAGSLVPVWNSATEVFYVDNTKPVVDVEITNGGGNCGKFGVGDIIEGTYSMTEIHSRSLSLWVTPSPEAAGGHLSILSVVPAAALPPPIPGPSASNSLSYSALTLSSNGASGTWELDTDGMDPCGYNIRISGVDRTIVNSGLLGWRGSDIEGFCLD